MSKRASNRYLEGHVGSTPIKGSENLFSEYFDLRTLLHYLHFIQVTSLFITYINIDFLQQMAYLENRGVTEQQGEGGIEEAGQRPNREERVWHF